MGPQPLGFLPTEYSINGAVGTIGTILGAFAYKTCLRGAHLRTSPQQQRSSQQQHSSTLSHTHFLTLLSLAGTLFAILIVLGAMVNALSLVLATGLITTKPAAVFFAVGDEFIHHLIGFMLSMPILILIAAICPEGKQRAAQQ